MQNQIQKLYDISLKKERKIIGLMSGTSLDGLDIAYCNCIGNGLNTKIEVLYFTTVDYDMAFKQLIKSVFSKKQVDLERLCLLNEQIGIAHASMILTALEKWNIPIGEVDAIASHGQTIYHAPITQHQQQGFPNGTLQIGDGDHIAVSTGIITLSDFRQKHLAAGGEGAPLAVYGDFLLFADETENRIMLNIGGISNFTYLPAHFNTSDFFSTDIGPGNTLMDQYIQSKVAGVYYDKDAHYAKKGKRHQGLLNALLHDEFFKLPFPKTTGPELFNLDYLRKAQEQTNTQALSIEDVMATLCHFTTETIAQALGAVNKVDMVFMSGGGMHNPLVIDLLKHRLPSLKFTTTEALNIHPDAKEAILFALLANETLSGSSISFGNHPAIPSVCMGKISLPV